jgi:hypothetical protein
MQSNKLIQTLENMNLNTNNQASLSTTQQADKQTSTIVTKLEVQPVKKLSDQQVDLIANIPTVNQYNKLTSQQANREVNRTLKSVRIDQTILDRVKDMVYFENKKKNKILEQDIFEIALNDLLNKSGY